MFLNNACSTKKIRKKKRFCFIIIFLNNSSNLFPLILFVYGLLYIGLGEFIRSCFLVNFEFLKSVFEFLCCNSIISLNLLKIPCNRACSCLPTKPVLDNKTCSLSGALTFPHHSETCSILPTKIELYYCADAVTSCEHSL